MADVWDFVHTPMANPVEQSILEYMLREWSEYQLFERFLGPQYAFLLSDEGVRIVYALSLRGHVESKWLADEWRKYGAIPLTHHHMTQWSNSVRNSVPFGYYWYVRFHPDERTSDYPLAYLASSMNGRIAFEFSNWFCSVGLPYDELTNLAISQKYPPAPEAISRGCVLPQIINPKTIDERILVAMYHAHYSFCSTFRDIRLCALRESDMDLIEKLTPHASPLHMFATAVVTTNKHMHNIIMTWKTTEAQLKSTFVSNSILLWVSIWRRNGMPRDILRLIVNKYGLRSSWRSFIRDRLTP